MNNLIALIQRYAASFMVYFFIGALSALVEWGVFFTAYYFGKLHYIGASICGFMLATYINYLLSSHLGFRRRMSSVRNELAMVYLVSLAGLLINISFMIVIVELTGLSIAIGKVGGTGLAFVWNFLARQFCIFDKNPRWTFNSLPKRNPAVSEALKNL
ncbi:GtrA family protein [Skermanella mucosa]|uniref:GtrA family protein n=1 Tax=Skermanella mucosa TaxID=1789672 RepID=UPI00192BAEFB|nr:GtrA family protein [Skermanella mucosa]UEM22819.1 GtrA family protein [Skermanella mucosa]